MCQGLVRLLLAIKMLGADVSTESPFNTEAERFQQRFSCLAQIETPEPLDYQAYVANTDPRGASAAEVCLTAALICFQSCFLKGYMCIKCTVCF